MKGWAWQKKERLSKENNPPSQLRCVGWFQTPSQWRETEKFGVHNQKSLAQKNWLGPNEALAFTIEYAEDSAGLWFTLKPPHNGGKLQSFAFTTKNLWHKKTALAHMKGWAWQKGKTLEGKHPAAVGLKRPSNDGQTGRGWMMVSKAKDGNIRSQLKGTNWWQNLVSGNFSTLKKNKKKKKNQNQNQGEIGSYLWGEKVTRKKQALCLLFTSKWLKLRG